MTDKLHRELVKVCQDVGIQTRYLGVLFEDSKLLTTLERWLQETPERLAAWVNVAMRLMRIFDVSCQPRTATKRMLLMTKGQRAKVAIVAASKCKQGRVQ